MEPWRSCFRGVDGEMFEGEDEVRESMALALALAFGG